MCVLTSPTQSFSDVTPAHHHLFFHKSDWVPFKNAQNVNYKCSCMWWRFDFSPWSDMFRWSFLRRSFLETDTIVTSWAIVWENKKTQVGLLRSSSDQDGHWTGSLNWIEFNIWASFELFCHQTSTNCNVVTNNFNFQVICWFFDKSIERFKSKFKCYTKWLWIVHFT